jgi:hypothetical protein
MIDIDLPENYNDSTYIPSLWTAADAYVAQQVSGVAIGILTLGVIQTKPKCLACAAWKKARVMLLAIGGAIGLDADGIDAMFVQAAAL